MEITQEPLIRSRWNFLRLLPCMFAFQWRRRHSVMWHLWRQPWWHRRHGKRRMTQTFTRQGYGPICEFLLGYFLPLYILDVEEFNGVTFRTLPPPVDLENPVWTGSTRTLRVTHLFLWWNFMILPTFMFSRSGNSMVTLSEFYHHRLISKIQFEPEVLELWGYPSFSLVEFYDITYIYVFEVGEFNNDTFRILPLTVDLENPVRTGSTGTSRLPIWWNFFYITYIYGFEVGNFNGDTFSILPLPVDLENPGWTGNTGTSRLPILLPGRIFWYYPYLCFRGRGIQWEHIQYFTTTGWPRKSSLNRKYWNFEVTHLFLWFNFRILPIFMFSRSRNSMVTISEFYHHRLT